MQDHERGAATAVADPTTGIAVNHGRISAAIQEEQRLFSAFKSRA
jgi:hypothetical protein